MGLMTKCWPNHLAQWLIVSPLLLSACQPNLQKENFRKLSSDTPSPVVTSSQDGGDTSAQPSSDSNSPSAGSSTSVLPTPSSTTSNTFSVSPSASSTPSSGTLPSSLPSSSSSASNDTTKPIPGLSGQIEMASLTSTSLFIEWSGASDNKTPASSLQYLVYKSVSNNLTTVSSIEANGTAVGVYGYQLTGKSIDGLSPSTRYYFNVLVKDDAGNKEAYAAISITTDDETAPVVANSAITGSNIAATSLSLSWTAASDETTASSALQYLVVRSTLANVATVGDAEINGTAVGSYTANLTTKSISALISSRTYYFNVIVKDEAGNKSVYAMQSVSTLDISPPVAGNSGLIVASAITPTSMTLTWTKGADNFTATADLQYLVYQSTSNNVPSISGAEANGTALGGYTNDINTKAVSGLSPNTAYYFIVVLRDASGNKAGYSMLSTSTLPLPPSLPVRTETFAKASTAWIYPITASNGSLPLVYSLTTAPSGATINSSTGVISYSPGATLGDRNFSVLVTDASARTASRDFVLHVRSDFVCIWTGEGDTTFSAASNWLFCGGSYPQSGDGVVIDANATRQPVVSVAAYVYFATSSGGGGTVTVNPGVIFSANTVGSDVVIQGATPTCTSCIFKSGILNIYSGATLKIKSGITMAFSYVTVGNGTVNGNLYIEADTPSDSTTWPRVDCNAAGGTGLCGGISVFGSATTPSTISIDGLNIQASLLFEGIGFRASVLIKKMRNINFSITAVNGYTNYYTHNPSYFSFNDPSVLVEDTNWNNINFSQGVRGDTVAVDTYGSTGATPVTISGSGRAFGLDPDPYGIVTWANSSSSTCTWTGTIDTAWDKPGNWSNCTNGRNNYPDQLDRVIIPVTANQPVVAGNFAMRGTGTGTGGGTITVNANSNLYVSGISGDILASSIKFEGVSAGCTTCVVQVRRDLILGDGVTLTLLPNITISMGFGGRIIVGESSGRTNRAANFVALGGPTPANYPVISGEHGSVQNPYWYSINLNGKIGTNSTLSIDGLVLKDLATESAGSLGIILEDRFTVSKIDHLHVTTTSGDPTGSTVLHVSNCSNSSIVTTWNDLTIATDPAPRNSIIMTDASCAGISPITITGQGAGYGSSGASDPNGRLNWN